MGVSSNRVESFSNCQDLETSLPTAAAMEPLEIHKVCLPPSTTTLQALKGRFSEIFFPDDPLNQFKNQPFARKLVLGLEYFFPIFHWASEYNLMLLKSDVISGITIASLSIPQGISYAKLANLPPIVGLYSSFVPPLLYAVLGSSRHLAVGPVSIASLVMGTMLREMVSPVQEPILFLQLAFTATFFAGVFQASLATLRLGFIVDFLSKATLIGFMAGAAIIVSLQQLKGLLGIVHFTTQMGFVPVMVSVFKHRTEWSWQTILMGFCFLLFLLTARHISMRKPKLFWVSAAAPLASVVLSTLAVFFFQAQNHGIKTIGHLQQGLNPPSANMLYFHGPFLGLAIKTGIVTGILALTEGIAVGRTFASLNNYQVDGNKEMLAIGLMNMAGSCTSCYVTTGSFSRSAVNYNAGAKTAMSNVVMAATVLVTLLFLMPLFYHTPNVILAAIIITAVIGLIDFRAAFTLWRVDKLDFLACLSALLGVLFISVQMGLAIAVGISIFKILIHVTRPKVVTLGKVPGTQVYRNIGHYGDASSVASFLILSIESPIYFANSTYLQERILRSVREEEERIQTVKGSPLKCIILDMAAVTSIDTSGIGALSELKQTLKNRSLELVLANPVGDVMEKLHASNTLKSFGSRAFT
ncbi:putative sulfate transporter 3.4 [Cinnamomum micranthum f. kanehirae]|uniref:Putative sulfate transporter 3.4 n=1 Tax=Cinnamomum micranthum f. kanehirae TaxID=337451 RepID=A0A443N5N7_9MAGN|nr:putative sulfate transporter 3.4 [Cinnamomum micranthum f. kanehirae]